VEERSRQRDHAAQQRDPQTLQRHQLVLLRPELEERVQDFELNDAPAKVSCGTRSIWLITLSY
jgi:GH43 family beta-xylosidase